MPFQIKRIYDPAADADGRRILVDRLWPRGVSKERAALSEWMKDVAPSTALRTWFAHMTEHFDVFAARYREELAHDPEKQRAVARLRDMAGQGVVTLLYAAKNPAINHAVVLRNFLENKG